MTIQKRLQVVQPRAEQTHTEATTRSKTIDTMTTSQIIGHLIYRHRVPLLMSTNSLTLIVLGAKALHIV